MKWPKLKNYVVCMFLLFLPALLLLAAGIGSMFLADKYGDWLGFLGLIFIASPLVYIFGCFATLGCMEAVLKWVKSRINAPVRYDYSGNGTTASRIEETIVSRVKNKFKKPVAPARTKNTPVCLGSKHYISNNMFYSSTERGAIVFKTSHLNVDLYHNIMYDAMVQHRAIHSKYWNKTKNEAKSGIISPLFATVVIIIADSIDPKVAEVVLKKKKAEKGYVLPCVIDTSNQSYFFDGEKDFSVLFSYVFEKNVCINLMKKLIFGGKAPKPDKKYISSFEEADFTPETPFFEYWRKAYREMKDAFKDDKKMLKKLSEKLCDGQTEIIEDVCYCKIGDNIGSCWLCENDDDEDNPNPKKVDVLIHDSWEYPKQKTLTKEDKKTLLRLTEAALKKEGYEYTITED